MTEKYLTLKEVAEHLKIGKSTLYRMRRLRPIDFPVATVRSGACRWSCEHVGESRTSSL